MAVAVLVVIAGVVVGLRFASDYRLEDSFRARVHGMCPYDVETIWPLVDLPSPLAERLGHPQLQAVDRKTRLPGPTTGQVRHLNSRLGGDRFEFTTDAGERIAMYGYNGGQACMG